MTTGDIDPFEAGSDLRDFETYDVTFKVDETYAASLVALTERFYSPTLTPKLIAALNNKESCRLRSEGEVFFAYTDEADQMCADGRQLADCDAAQAAIASARNVACKGEREDRSGRVWTTFAQAMGSTCLSCAVQCTVEPAVLMENGKSTGTTRIAFIKPDPTMPIVHLDIDSITFANPKPIIRNRLSSLELPGDTEG